MKEPTTPAPRRGRRPGPGSTRQDVLDAARERFATDGFAATTIRLVAADAKVDVSQVMQFFGSKNELFAAVMHIPQEALDQLSTVFEVRDSQLGERVVRTFLNAWEDDEAQAAPLMATLRGAVVNEQAREQLRDFIQSRLLAGFQEVPSPDATLRAGIASALLVGLIVSRRIIGVPLLVEASREELVSIVGPAIQQVLVPPASDAGQ
ncbi:MAG: TetR family transcriptional regulator [Pseudomonas putida]|nr:TetR family transcriptional regulator [Pseudomonas putida]